MNLFTKIIYYLKRIIYLLFKENFHKKLKYDWSLYPKRYDIINNLIKFKNFKEYLELGCFRNENFDKINIPNKIGVDPVSGGTHRVSSDDFFSTNAKKFDLIFIDGLHTYDQVKKDINNSLGFLKENGVILIHDCLPRKIWYQTPNRMSFTWNGDVWKALVEFRTKPNLDVYTILADEGIGLILKRKNNNLLKISISNFQKLKFKDYFYNHSEFMNIIKHEDLNKIINNES